MSSDKDSAWARVTGKGIYPVEYARWLLTPWRRLISPPSMIVKRLGLKPTDRVLEIGCGPGYFSPTVARTLRQGHLTIFDFQDGMLDIAETRLKAGGLSNYTRQQGDAKALPFADASFDAAFMVTVLGEVGDPDAALKEARRVLKPGGRLSVTEMFGDPDRIAFEELRARAAAAGLVFERRFGPGFFYTANFSKP
ncbi:MAG TPA: methyltransferase domain-containing protein [Rhizomicrobium sp.]|nr:methyltransferase domain-containing protein [Rhizomicrobium sp.]